MLGELLRKLIATLPETPRMAMVLRYQEDLDPAEIAEAMGIPLGTVKSHIQRSLALLAREAGETWRGRTLKWTGWKRNSKTGAGAQGAVAGFRLARGGGHAAPTNVVDDGAPVAGRRRRRWWCWSGG